MDGQMLGDRSTETDERHREISGGERGEIKRNKAGEGDPARTGDRVKDAKGWTATGQDTKKEHGHSHGDRGR